MAERVRALVTDGHERAALATCRGLAAAGFSVSAAAAFRPAASELSRAVERRFSVTDPRTDAAAFVDQLVEILESNEHELLVPAAEASLLSVSEGRERIEPLARTGLPPHEVVLRALDRRAMVDAAECAGLPPPATVECADEPAALAAAAQLGYPVLLKPRRSVLPDVGLRLRQRPSGLVTQERTLRELLPLFGAPVAVQKHTAGTVVSLGGVSAGGALLGLCASRYHRTWPPAAGAASFTESVEPPAELVRRLEILLGELAWEGLFELELIELQDGGHAAIDFNPRPYGSLGLAIEAGANLPALWCAHLLGRKPVLARARPGFRYRWEEAELRNLLWRIRRGKLGEAAEILRPRRRTAHAFFRVRDPGPILAAAVGLIVRLGRHGRARRAESSV